MLVGALARRGSWTPLLAPRSRSKTVADGVYTDAQATRGAAAYDGACSGCHRADLGGGTGPALREQRFAREFADKDLKMLFTKIATTMPRNAAGSLADNVNLDIVAHLLKENGFPAGSQELDRRRARGDPRAARKAEAAASRRRFLLRRSGGLPHRRPAAHMAADPGERAGCGVALPRPFDQAPGKATSTPASTDRPLGTQTLHLLDAMAYAPDDHKGHTMYVRGLLIKLPGEQRMTISAFEMVSPTCRE